MNNDSRLLEKINTQLDHFMEVLGKGLPKPQRRFLHQMLFGIQASRDIKLSEVARNLHEEIKLIKTENRLSRNLQDPELSQQVLDQMLEHVRDRIDPDTVLAIDLTDISKPYAQKMDFLDWVWDGVEKQKTWGYWVLEVVGARVDQKNLYPLYSELYSAKAHDFISENHQIFKAMDQVNSSLKGKGIWVMDRGGDRKNLIRDWLARDLRFVVRLKGDRGLITPNRVEQLARQMAQELACPQEYTVEVDQQGYTEKRLLSLGKTKVHFPTLSGEDLFLVVVKGFGSEPLILLTNVTFSPLRILEIYLTRWKVEESIRFLKKEYHLEDVRVRTYRSLKNTVVLLFAVFYFLSVFLGGTLRLAVLLRKIYTRAKRFFQIPAFHQYALADGIFRVFFNTRWKYTPQSQKPFLEPNQLFLQFDFD